MHDGLDAEVIENLLDGSGRRGPVSVGCWCEAGGVRQFTKEPLKRFSRRARRAAHFQDLESNAVQALGPSIQAARVRFFAVASRRAELRGLAQGVEAFAADIDHFAGPRAWKELHAAELH